MNKDAYGTLIWKKPTLSAVVRILENPAYAGAYTYGRWEYRGDARSPKTGKARAKQRPQAQWPVLIQEHHPAYVSWEEYMQTRGNSYARIGSGTGAGAWPVRALRCCKGSCGVGTVDARWGSSIMLPKKSVRPRLFANRGINRTGKTRSAKR